MRSPTVSRTMSTTRDEPPEFVKALLSRGVSRRVVIVVAALAVLGALGGGFYLIGPPADERARRLDGRRENDLRQLRLAIDLYWTRNNRLPASLDELATEAGTTIYSRDPETGQPYEYSVKPPDQYELCATFARESAGRHFWSHHVGHRCFPIVARTIRP
jgi:hypothetical protein